VTSDEIRNELLELISAPWCRSDRICVLYRRWLASLR
jgi:hypothetical protein